MLITIDTDKLAQQTTDKFVEALEESLNVTYTEENKLAIKNYIQNSFDSTDITVYENVLSKQLCNQVLDETEKQLIASSKGAD